MQRLLLSFACALGIAFSLSHSAAHATAIYGLSPNQPPAAREAQVKRLIAHLATNLAPGESARIMDAYAAEGICTFSVPDKSAYRHPRAKLQANAPCAKALIAFARNAPREPRVIEGAISLPLFLRHVGALARSEAPIDVIIFGSPLYDDPDEGLTMRYGAVPNDGHIRAGRNATPFGAGGDAKALAGFRVHLKTPGLSSGASWRLHDAHGQAVERFWTLFVAAQGGTLVSFTHDEDALLERAAQHVGAPAHRWRLGNPGRLEMLPFAPRGESRTSIYDRPLARNAPSPAQIAHAGRVEIGIRWDCAACDLDLYAVPRRGAEVIYYVNLITPEGRLFKDFRRSPDYANGLEMIAFSAPIDLSALALAINHYSGAASRITGEVRIALDGATYAAPFVFETPAPTSGQGADVWVNTGRAPARGWIIIDPLAVIGAR